MVAYMRCFSVLCVLVCLAASAAHATMIINPTFNDAQFTADGYSASDIANIHTAFNLAAAEFTANFSDNIHININVGLGWAGAEHYESGGLL